MRRLAIAALPVAALLVAGCKTVADGELYEQSILDRMHELGDTADAVECPARIPLGVDNRFDCVLVKGGGRTVVEVHLFNDAPFHWKLRAK